MYELTNTKNNERLLWLRERQKGIGGSDIGTLIGINKYKTKLDLYFDKISPIQDESCNKFTESGNQLENFVAEWFAERTNLEVRISEQENYTDVDVPYFKASVDRLINTDTILEIKTTSIHTEEPQATWISQLQWYLGVLRREQGVICWVTLPYGFDYDKFNSKVWSKSELEILKTCLKIDWRVVERDDYYIQELRDYACEFWNNNVLAKNPPEPTNAYDALRLYPVAESKKTREISNEFYSTLNRLKNLNEILSNYEKEKEDLSNAIKIYMQDNEALTRENKVVCTYKNQVSSRVDTDKLKASGLYTDYTKQTNSRVLRLKSL